MKELFFIVILICTSLFVYTVASEVPPVPTAITAEGSVAYVKTLKGVQTFKTKLDTYTDLYNAEVVVERSRIIEQIRTVTTEPIGSYQYVDVWYREEGEGNKKNYVTTLLIPTNGSVFDVYLFDTKDNKFKRYILWKVLGGERFIDFI
jgi:hypothetical protein